MQGSDTINIVCVCDDHYAILLAALLKSIDLKHHTGEKIEVIIVDDEISKRSKKKVNASVSSGLIDIQWLPMQDCIPDKTNLPLDKSSLPLNIYTRLFIPYFIKKDIKKVIFMDVDMIVLEDISKLWNTDLGDNIVAAVQDQFIQVVSRWGGVSNYEQLGIAADNKYFNAGLLVMDIEKWNANDITNKVLNAILDNAEVALFQDQYGLNAVLAKHWFELDVLWNRFAYSEEERPYLIHFTGRKPIYTSYEFNEKYKAIFFEILSQTPWKNFKPIGETKRYIKKVRNVFEKFKKRLVRKQS